MPDKGPKDELRRELLARRDRIPPEVRNIKNSLIRDRLISSRYFQDSSVIFSFASFRSEVDTFGIMEESFRSGKKVVVPKVDPENHQLILCEIHGTGELEAGYMGIPEPARIADERRADIDSVDLVIIPGAGFDPEGNRIGYGGGYYDRLLSGLMNQVAVVAPAFEEQIVDMVPSETHDIKVSVIVTDRRLIECR